MMNSLVLAEVYPNNKSVKFIDPSTLDRTF